MLLNSQLCKINEPKSEERIFFLSQTNEAAAVGWESGDNWLCMAAVALLTATDISSVTIKSNNSYGISNSNSLNNCTYFVEQEQQKQQQPHK